MADFFDRLDIFGLGRAAGDALGIEDRDEEDQAMLDRVMAELGPAVAQGFAERAPGALSRAAAAPIPGISPEQTGDLANRVWEFASQSPLVDTTVTGMQTYLDLLDQGVPEGEAIRRGIGIGGRPEAPEPSALGYARENLLDYLIPGGKRPPNQSFGDIEQLDLGPLEAAIADTALGSLELTPIISSAGRTAALGRVLPDVVRNASGRPIPNRAVMRTALEDVMDFDATRIQQAPARPRSGDIPTRTGSYDDLPYDIGTEVLRSMDVPSRSNMTNHFDLRGYLEDLTADINRTADSIVSGIARGNAPKQLTLSTDDLVRTLKTDFAMDPAEAESIASEVGRRAYQVGSQMRRSPVQRLGARLARTEVAQPSYRGGTINAPLSTTYMRGSRRGLSGRGLPDYGRMAEDAGLPEAARAIESQRPGAQERMNARNILELARERVRLANEADRRGVSLDDLIAEERIGQNDLLE